MTVDLKETSKTLFDRVINNPYIPHEPFVKQAVFLLLDEKEALYGGAAGGGKSDALLMAALMYVDVPGYNALILRKSYKDLSLPSAIMARSHEWLQSTDAKWNGAEYRWTFPSGATLSFGYLKHDKDKFRYQSAEFQFIGFDELTQFPSDHYLYMFSRLRRLKKAPVPLRVRGGTNPGGMGNDWVYERFVVDDSRPFIPAKLDDNDYIDKEEYRKSLRELDETTRKQLEDGLWVVDPDGKPFLSAWWRGQNRYLDSLELLDDAPIARYISWDTAFEDKKDSAYSSYVVIDLRADYRIKVREVWRGKLIFPELPDKMIAAAKKWNRDNLLRGVIVEGAASGKPAIQTLRAGSDLELASKIIEFTPKGSKEERANRAGIWCKRGLVLLPHPEDSVSWLSTFERELFNFPEIEKKDQVDAFSQGIIYLENFLTVAWHGVQARKSSVGKDSRVKRAMKKKTASKI